MAGACCWLTNILYSYAERESMMCSAFDTRFLCRLQQTHAATARLDLSPHSIPFLFLGAELGIFAKKLYSFCESTLIIRSRSHITCAMCVQYSACASASASTSRVEFHPSWKSSSLKCFESLSTRCLLTKTPRPAFAFALLVRSPPARPLVRSFVRSWRADEVTYRAFHFSFKS